MKKFPELKYLDMRSIRHQIFYFPEASLRFESLCELKCDTSIDSSYFYGLAQLCQYIQELIIINVDPTNLHGVVKLIEVQKNLKYFEWKDDHSMFDIVHASGPDQDFYNEVFPKFYRLKTLMTSFDSYDEEQLKLCTYRDLEIFKMNNCNLKAASIIIENSGGHLKKILIEPYELIEFIDSFSKNSFDFIRNIHKFCPLIEFLSLIFFPLDMYFAELEKLLKTCHNLKSLLLFSMPYGVLSRKEILDYGENLLEVLIISTPINLKELRFCGNFEFSLETLEEFLERWEGSTLSILISNDTCEGEDYKKLINKYKDSKVIKDFRRESYENFLLQREFYDLFTKKFLELKYLDLKSIKHQIFYFPEASRFRFESLCELKCDTSTESSFFYGLAHFSQYIQRLIIDNNIFSKVDFGITKLIEVQKNLKYFEWNDISTNSNVRKNPYKEILLALGKKADNINHLKLFFMYPDCTLQKVFPNFHKLKTLIINRFNDFNEDQLRMCVYRDLEILYINHYELKAASIIIENSGEHLKKIYIDQNYNHRFHHDNFEEYSLILIRKIYKNCSSIEYLCLPYYPSMDHFIEIEKLLKVCQNLKTLLIYKIMNEIETEGKLLNNGEELLKILIKSTPTNLREIVFLYDFNFSLEVLEKFLGKWKGHALSILTITNPAYKAENYVKLINKYKNDGVIKDFRHESYKNAVNIVKINFKI
ncbi:20942_t:CDS:2 [Rhizophagus irregularis]|nr:20942_t:CDS:2 [Rhizophagus irregularis]